MVYSNAKNRFVYVETIFFVQFNGIYKSYITNIEEIIKYSIVCYKNFYRRYLK